MHTSNPIFIFSCSQFSSHFSGLGGTTSYSEDPGCCHPSLSENPVFETELRDGYRLVRMEEVLVSIRAFIGACSECSEREFLNDLRWM